MNIITQEIVSRFRESWDETEIYYERLIVQFKIINLVSILAYIQKLKQNGENQFFRLGTSMHSLIISRSVDFGLRDDQKYIKIETVAENDFEITLRDGENVYREYRLTSLEEARLSKLLITLKNTLVD